MWQGEYHRSLVDDIIFLYFIHAPFVAKHKKAGEVMFVGFDGCGQHFESVNFGGSCAANGCMSNQLLCCNVVSSQRSIFVFHNFDTGQGVQKISTLHQCYRVRLYFFDIVNVLTGQGRQAVRNAQFEFSGDRHFVFLQQFVVL